MKRVVTREQRAALEALAGVLQPGTYLADGVAVALRLHHRQSRDLDLFVGDADPAVLAPALGSRGARILSRAEGTLHLDLGGVPTSILSYRHPLLVPLERLRSSPVPVASFDDLECMKLAAIAGRGPARDFWDLHAMLTSRARPLSDALDAYRRKYVAEDVGHVVRSLVYFDDAETGPMPVGLSAAHWATIQRDLRSWVRGL